MSEIKNRNNTCVSRTAVLHACFWRHSRASRGSRPVHATGHFDEPTAAILEPVRAWLSPTPGTEHSRLPATHRYLNICHKGSALFTQATIGWTGGNTMQSFIDCPVYVFQQPQQRASEATRLSRLAGHHMLHPHRTQVKLPGTGRFYTRRVDSLNL